MRIKSLLLVLILVLSLTFTATELGSDKLERESRTIVNADAVDSDAAKDVSVKAANVTVTMRDIALFLETKNAHYPLSDEFIEKYQQSGGGYIDYAKQMGRIVDKEKHEPDQKWHFFDSWLYPSIEDESNSLNWDSDAKSRVYNSLLCPELLLWIYEASGVDPVKVRNAKAVAEQGKSAKTNVSTIAKNMRACVPWDDIANAVLSFTPSPRVTLNADKLTLTVGEEYTIAAKLESSDVGGNAEWSVIEGEDFIGITPDGDEVTISAIAKGTAKVKVSYGEDLSAVCAVTVKEKRDESNQTSAEYHIKYDLGNRTTAKLISSTDELFGVFRLDGEGGGIIASVSQADYIYGGGYGGSGDTKWYAGDMLKLGTTSTNGSMTLNLNVKVNRVIITGYAGASNGKLQVGDSASTDWTSEANDNKTTSVTCSDMNTVSKDIVEGNQTSTIVIDFDATASLTIATTNKKPFYITSIEFVICADNAQ